MLESLACPAAALVFLAGLAAVHAEDGGAGYRADFESPDFSPGSIDGQHGWSVDQGKAEIVAGVGLHGTSGLVLYPSAPFSQARLSLALDPGLDPASYVDLQIRPVAGFGKVKEEMLDIDSARVGLFRQPDSGEAVLWVFHGDGQGGGTWMETATRLPVDPVTGQAESWHRLTIQENAERQTWELWVDGVWAASGMGFQERKDAGAPVCILMGDPLSPVVLDEVGLWSRSPLPEEKQHQETSQTAGALAPAPVTGGSLTATARPGADTDADGLPDQWEREHGLNPEDPSDSSSDPDKDGLVNRDEFALQLDPRKADLIAAHLPPPQTHVFSRIQFPIIRRGKVVDSRKPFEVRD